MAIYLSLASIYEILERVLLIIPFSENKNCPYAVYSIYLHVILLQVVFPLYL
jgi:hypothetical protein